MTAKILGPSAVAWSPWVVKDYAVPSDRNIAKDGGIFMSNVQWMFVIVRLACARGHFEPQGNSTSHQIFFLAFAMAEVSAEAPSLLRFSRKNTDPTGQCLGAKDAKGPARLRQRTEPNLGDRSARFEALSVPQQALSKLHRMHTLKVLGDKLHEDTSEAAMDKMWTGNSWHLFPKLPLAHEKSHAVRAWQVRPPSFNAPSLMKDLGVAAINSKGQKGWGDRSLGQDSCSVSVLPSGWHVFSLFDGHGQSGHWPALRASRTLPYLLEASHSCKAMLKHQDVEAALYHAFEKVQADLVQQCAEEDISLQLCGCTAVCVLQHPDQDRIWIANCGDSKAIMIVPGLGVVGETVDHKPSLEKELQRVKDHGMELRSVVHEDGFVEERLCVEGEDYPGLCMTRSLGDLCVKHHGIIAEPEVFTWNTGTYAESYVLIASDGLWDFLSTEEVSKMVLQSIAAGDSLHAAAKKILKRAQKKWEEFDDFYCDDITVVLIPDAQHGHKAAKTSCHRARDDGCCAGLRHVQCKVMWDECEDFSFHNADFIQFYVNFGALVVQLGSLTPSN